MSDAAYIRNALRANGLEPNPADVDRLAASHESLRAAIDAVWRVADADRVHPAMQFEAVTPGPEWDVSEEVR